MIRDDKELIKYFKEKKLYPQFRALANTIAILGGWNYDTKFNLGITPLFDEIENHGGMQDRKYFSLWDKEDIEKFISNAMLCKQMGELTYKDFVSRFKLEGRQIKWFKYINNPSMLMAYAIHRKYGLYDYKPRKI
jgi:hypothetical protein